MRAVLGTAVLSVLASDDLHGYGIAERLAERGFGRPRGGSLYPLLAALEADGAVSADWQPGTTGPGRRIYRLTPLGRTRLDREVRDWASLAAALSDSARITSAQEVDHVQS